LFPDSDALFPGVRKKSRYALGMKISNRALALCAVLIIPALVSGCGKLGGLLDNGSSGSNSPKPLDPSQLQFKGPGGYFPIAKANLMNLDVKILPCAQTQGQTFSTTLPSLRVQALFQPISFNAPVEQANPNLPLTGVMVIHFDDLGIEGIRTMNILGTRLVQDNQYPEVFYATSKPLDMTWLGY
jgi:hypothetical protein